MYLQSDPGDRRLGSGGLGLCVVPKQVTIRKLICSEADLAAIGAEMGKGRPLVIREVRTALDDAVRRAVVLIERAESQLTMPRLAGQAGEAMRQRFRDAFGTTPEFIPTWRKAGDTWDMGAVVRERLRCAAKIMSEGDVEFVAWGPGSCPFTYEWKRTTWAVVEGGRSRICFGQRFWRAARRSDIDGMATTILHECLHIYFDTVTHHREKWAYNVATCYERYVLLCNGIPIPKAVDCPCPSKTPGAAVRRDCIARPALHGVGLGLGQPKDTSDTGLSIEAIRKALELNPADGYVMGSPSRAKLNAAFSSVPLTAAFDLHKQLSTGTGSLGKLFHYRLHRATRKTLLDVLWNKHLAQQAIDRASQANVKAACAAAKAVLSEQRARLTEAAKTVDGICAKGGEDSDACQQARFSLLSAKTTLEDGIRRQQSICQ